MKLHAYALSLIQGGALVAVWFGAGILWTEGMTIGAIFYTAANLILTLLLAVNGKLEG